MPHYGVDEVKDGDGFPLDTTTKNAPWLLVHPAVWHWRCTSLPSPRDPIRDVPTARPWLVSTFFVKV